MRQVIVLFLTVFAVAAFAQDPCATAIPLQCGAAPVTYAVGDGGWLTPPTACGDPIASCSATLFEVTLTAPTELSMSIAFPGASGVPHLYLFEDCGGLTCVDDLAVSGDTTWSVCLPAGTFYVVMNEPTCLYYFYEFGVSCQPCSDPVVNESMPWGGVKSLYR